MNTIFAKILYELEKKNDLMLVTIISENGSSPRGIGAFMLVGAAGRILGTVGGGPTEKLCEERAVGLIAEKKSEIHEYRLHENNIEDIGAVCGGDVDVLFKFIDGSSSLWAEIAKCVLSCIADKKAAWFVQRTDGYGVSVLDENGHVIAGEPADAQGLMADAQGLTADAQGLTADAQGLMADAQGLTADAQGLTTDAQELTADAQELTADAQELTVEGCVFKDGYFSMKLPIGERAIIFGGGHCAKALAPLLDTVGFRVTVMDCREEYADKERFPTAEEVICGDYRRINDYLTIDSKDYIVVMTNGHSFDFDVQEQVLRMPTAYVGVIGSKSKTASVNARLREAGVPEEGIAKVHTPIGTAIKAVTPEEIAVSIAGEMILVRATYREAAGIKTHGCPMH